MRVSTSVILVSMLISSFGLLSPGNAQIVEEQATPAVIPDSSVTSGQSFCYPPCRKGYFCREGTCESLCNPSCEEGMVCGEDGNCEFAAVVMRKHLDEIADLRVVRVREEVPQGLILTTNNSRSRVKIGDSVFVFDRELCLITPRGNYVLKVDAPMRFIDRTSVEVKSGAVETVEVRLRPFKANVGLAFGPAFMEREVSLSGDLDVGVNILTLHYFGLTGTYIGPWESNITFLNDLSDSLYPDTVRESAVEMYGAGVTYGYTGFRFVQNIFTIVPQISMGYWLLDDWVDYTQRDLMPGDMLRYTSLNSISYHHYQRYYVRPGVEVRVGYRMFSFRIKVEGYLGSAAPIPSVNAGFTVAVP